MALTRTRMQVAAVCVASSIAVTAAAGGSLLQVAEGTTETTRELERIEQRLVAAWKAGDCAAWGAMLAEDWAVTHITGAIVSKAEALQMCKAPAAPIVRFDMDDVRVRLFGDTAVVTGRSSISIGGGSPAEITLRFTDVLIRREGRWQVVASHATRLATP